jgi:endoglucanase
VKRRISLRANACLIAAALLIGCSGEAGASAGAPSAPGATVTAQQLSPGWNLGNSLEATGAAGGRKTNSQETLWGNPVVTQAMLNGVKAAGFNSVRIPVAWAQYADAKDDIAPFWMRRVAQVVDYARNAGLYVILNIHWDGGWMQPTYADQARANARLARFWSQIVTRFRDYDEHLLFAGTNEVMVKDVYSAPTPENCAVQIGFNKIFVDTVRATGGNNAARYLVVQGYNTNIDHTLICNATLPADSAAARLMMEVHYYDPYNFTLNTGSATWLWGSIATSPAATDSWGDEAHADAQFQKMEANFIDKGVPVILGEYAASLRTEYDAPGKYRTYWDQYVTRSAYRHGMVPVYWDNGYTANHNSGLFDRATGKISFPDTFNAFVNAAK